MDDLSRERNRPQIGLVLSSGGSRGSAHIGVLKVLEAEQIPIDIVVGASIGTVVGGAYAAGVRVSQIEQEWLSTNIWKLARNLRPFLSLRKRLRGTEPMEVFRKLVGNTTIEALPKKFAAVATDIETGRQVIITKGSLARAMRASSSIPMLLTPADHEGRYLADGGMTNPLPINVARELGAEIVIAVDVNGRLTKLRKVQTNGQEKKLQQKRRPPNFIESLSATLIIWQSRLAEYSLQEFPADVLIQPNFYAGFFGYNHGEEGISAGEKAAKEALPQIKKLLTEK